MCGFWLPPIVRLSALSARVGYAKICTTGCACFRLNSPHCGTGSMMCCCWPKEFVRKFNREHRKAVEGIAPDCLEALKAHSWPGNVRELRNAIERAVIMSRSPMLSIGDLPKELSSQPGPRLGFTVRLGSTLEEVENELIARTISICRWQQVAGRSKSSASDGELFTSNLSATKRTRRMATPTAARIATAETG